MTISFYGMRDAPGFELNSDSQHDRQAFDNVITSRHHLTVFTGSRKDVLFYL